MPPEFVSSKQLRSQPNDSLGVEPGGSILIATMTVFGAPRPLPCVPAKVS
jgi:hypothetical protein